MSGGLPDGAGTRHFGVYPAIVTDLVDPDRLGIAELTVVANDAKNRPAARAPSDARGYFRIDLPAAKPADPARTDTVMLGGRTATRPDDPASDPTNGPPGCDSSSMPLPRPWPVTPMALIANSETGLSTAFASFRRRQDGAK